MAGDVIVTLQQQEEEEEEEVHEKEVTTETPHMNMVFLWVGGGAGRKQEADGASEAVGQVKMMHRRCRSLRQYDGGDLRAVLGAIAGRLPRRSSCGWHVLCLLRILASTPTSS